MHKLSIHVHLNELNLNMFHLCLRYLCACYFLLSLCVWIHNMLDVCDIILTL